MLVLAAAGLVLGLVAGLVTYNGNVPGDLGGALRRVLAVLAPIGVGLYAWCRPPHERFGRLLYLLGVVWFVAILSTASLPLLYSLGRVAGWIAELFLLYLVLSFPTGRLPDRADRALALFGAAIVGLVFLPSALLVGQFPVPSVPTLCVAGCPANALNVLGFEPAWVDTVLSPLRDGLTIVLMIAVIARLAWRVATSSKLLQRTLLPVLVVAIARSAVLAVAVGLRAAGTDTDITHALAETVLVGSAFVAAAFLLGLLSWRIYVAESLQQLATPVKRHVPTTELQDAIAQALGDPTAEIALPTGEGWIGTDGKPLVAPAPRSGRTMTEVRDGQRRIAAIVHDDLFAEQTDFVEAVATYSLLSLDNDRLSRTVRTSARELDESRARLAAAADAERRRIARDLHDGAQQRLVALRIRLDLLIESVERDPHAAVEQLRQHSRELGEALDDVRSLAAGVYPPLLADRGLTDALQDVARRSPIPARLKADGIGRYPPQVESAVYFCCLEAMQNAAKHAPDATQLTLSIANGDRGLRFEVRDDGAGFDDSNGHGGAGLVNMHDRLEAVAGIVTVDSKPGEGTRVAGWIPPAAMSAHTDG